MNFFKNMIFLLVVASSIVLANGDQDVVQQHQHQHSRAHKVLAYGTGAFVGSCGALSGVFSAVVQADLARRYYREAATENLLKSKGAFLPPIIKDSSVVAQQMQCASHQQKLNFQNVSLKDYARNNPYQRTFFVRPFVMPAISAVSHASFAAAAGTLAAWSVKQFFT